MEPEMPMKNPNLEPEPDMFSMPSTSAVKPKMSNKANPFDDEAFPSNSTGYTQSSDAAAELFGGGNKVQNQKAADALFGDSASMG